MNHKTYLWIGLLFLMPLFAAAQVNSAYAAHEKTITKAIAEKNTDVLSNYFFSSVDFSIPGADGVYSKAQAEQVVKKFFSKHEVKSFKIKHNGSSRKGTFFSIGDMQTNTKNFSVYFLMREEKGTYKIHQFQIQAEN